MVRFGLIGRGIGHSFSADFFNSKFRLEGIDAVYDNFDIEDISEIRSIIADFPDLRGLNVTSPYKRVVIPYLDSLSSDALLLEAVNVIEFSRDGEGRTRLIGHNTDSPGFGLTLPLVKEHLMKSSKDKSAIVLGTGGASSAVAMALEKEGFNFKVASRAPLGNQISYEEVNRLLPGMGLIVNATPLGMYPDVMACPDIDYSLLGPSHFLYDLIYNPAESLFLRMGALKGTMTKNGLDMLRNQALLAWEIWNR